MLIRPSTKSRRQVLIFAFATILTFNVWAEQPRGEPSEAGPPTQGPGAAPQEVEESAAPAETQDTRPAPLAAGLKAYLDPETGRLISSPHPDDPYTLVLSPRELDRMRTSHEGLVEEIRPDGSVLLHTHHRFMSASFATVGSDGQIQVTHSSTLSRGTVPSSVTSAPEDSPQHEESSDDQ